MWVQDRFARHRELRELGACWISHWLWQCRKWLSGLNVRHDRDSDEAGRTPNLRCKETDVCATHSVELKSSNPGRIEAPSRGS